MEEAFASGAFSEPPKRAPKLALDTKQSAESIDIIVNELGLTRHLAEQALAKHNGISSLLFATS
ncbi:uncharacterized protein EI90DRAFT_3061531, partial [Cantharellus anzutake]|uniref:uncharacterized protein n=1 Tax=Cantharellus anzutake TaxID=1750568 RepID=UPI001904C1A3